MNQIKVDVELAKGRLQSRRMQRHSEKMRFWKQKSRRRSGQVFEYVLYCSFRNKTGGLPQFSDPKQSVLRKSTVVVHFSCKKYSQLHLQTGDIEDGSDIEVIENKGQTFLVHNFSLFQSETLQNQQLIPIKINCLTLQQRQQLQASLISLSSS